MPVRARVTRRGRLVLMGLAFTAGILLALVALFVFDVPSAIAGADEPEPVVTVASGDTLWGYAEAYAADGVGAQEFVDEVRELNGLSTMRLTEGQQLVLPADAGVTP